MKFDLWGIKCGAVAALIMTAGPAQAGDFVIPDGVTVTTTQALMYSETGTVEEGGAISVSYMGINAHSGNTINNYGTIEASTAIAVYLDTVNTLNNTGAIKADTNSIQSWYGNIINNSGTIEATDSTTILAYYDNIINNSGLITSNNSGAFVLVSGNTINNSGVIKARNFSSMSGGDGNIINNSGIIESGTTFAIAAVSGNTVNNSGTIKAGTKAIELFDGNVIYNYGSILASSPEEKAINLLQGDNTLNMFAGSRIVGRISLGGSDSTVNLHRDESWLMTIEQANPADNIFNTFGAPVAFIDGVQAVATFEADTTIFAEDDEALADLTGAINNVLRNRLSLDEPGDNLWVQGIAARRESGSDGPAGDVVDHDLAGAMTGFTKRLGAATHGGLFAGYADAERENATGHHEIESRSFFGGAFARGDFDGIFTHFTVTGGWNDTDSQRRIVSNQSATGIEFAEGSSEGWFVNPELTVGAELPVYGLTLVPSASVGYAGLYLDGFQETGSMASISFTDHTVELLTGRLQLELKQSGRDAYGLWQTALRAGVLGRSNLGDDDLSGVLASTTAFTVALEDDDSTVAGFVGGDASLAVTPDTQVYLGGEAAFEDDGDNAYSGRIGASVSF